MNDENIERIIRNLMSSSRIDGDVKYDKDRHTCFLTIRDRYVSQSFFCDLNNLWTEGDIFDDMQYEESEDEQP
ncbi:hypothetical protein [Scytonema sp. NUACC26]|uniref:hypothetical protein n=1 Tax=Scytonema sp. NUACC26 TaxID=3140176 RepID=UPI0034DBDEF8